MKLLRRTINFSARAFLTDGRKLIGRLDRRLRNKQITIRESRAIAPSQRDYCKLAAEIEHFLHANLLRIWFPKSLDRTYGGYIPRLSSNWSEREQKTKYLVCQARLVWTAACAAGIATECREEYIGYALHGLEFLDQVMRDEKFGGFHWKLGVDGQVDQHFGDDKFIYGTAFVVFAAAEVYHRTHNDRALRVAVDAYQWLEHHAADRKHGGYFERLRRDGTPVPPPRDARRDKDLYTLGNLAGYKSMNSHLHMLEAYTLLYRVWPDENLRGKVEHLLGIVRDRIAVAPGALNLYFTPDWRAVPAHDSYGHDVEAAYLLVEGSNALGQPDNAATWSIARELVDHALTWGWDENYGGFYNKGEAFSKAHDTRKFGWVQAEGLNALLVMHKRFGQETSRYLEFLFKQWRFIRKVQIDHRRGSWHTVLSREGRRPANRAKTDDTGAIYHYVRAMIEVSRGLLQLSGDQSIENRDSGAAFSHG